MNRGDAASGLRALMRQAPQLVTVVTAVGPSGPRGITVSSMTSVSLAPALVLVSIARTASAHPAIAAGRFRVHLLAEDQAPVSSHFATPGLSSAEQFDGPWATAAGAGGPPRIPGCLGWAECETVAAHAEGDHTVFIGRVLETAVERPGAPPLVYQNRGYRRLAGSG